MALDASGGFGDLLYRYWFFNWLFRDAQRGSLHEREAALRHNRRQARWLPTYMRRWSILGLALYTLGVALEHLDLATAAACAFVPACITASVLAVATVGWIGLQRAMPAASLGRGARDF